METPDKPVNEASPEQILDTALDAAIDAPIVDEPFDGPVDGTFPPRRLHAFFCLLLQEGLTAGVIEQLVERAELGVIDVPNAHIAAYAAELEYRLLPQEDQDHIAAATFWHRIHTGFDESGWGEMVSADFAEHAEACGLLEPVPYDPKKHGDIEGDAEEGDTIHFPTDLARRLFARATKEA